MELIKTDREKTPLRTPFVIGEPRSWPPEIGNQFILVSKSLDNVPGMKRVIVTSRVRAALEDENSSWTIMTEYSSYKLDVVNDTEGINDQEKGV